jgi:alcohol dehydrogenase class IV
MRWSSVIDDVRPNPDVAQLSGLYNRFWQSDADGDASCDAIVAVGGGSAIDTAKALDGGHRQRTVR